MSPQHLTVPADLTHSAAVRSAAQQFFLDAGLTHRWQYRLVLVVDELFMNAVKYGSTPDDTVEITFSIVGGSVTVSITDANATGIEPAALIAKIKENEADMHALATSGRGLALISQEWTDALEVTKSQSGGITLTFHKTIS